MTFEMRYDEAFLLWDRSGELWNASRTLFNRLKVNQAVPNQTTFIADDRYILNVMINRTAVTDHRPTGSSEKIAETIATFANLVSQTLDLSVLNRVGTRYQFSMKCKTVEEARARAAEAIPAFGSYPKLFNIAPTSCGPTVKIEADDGDLAFVAQLYAQEKKYEFNPPPDLAEASGLERTEQSIFELVLDFDFSTKKPIPVSAFDAHSWLVGASKAISRDADLFLNYLASKST